MDLTNIKNVGIIGAGVAGLSVAKALLAKRLTCTIFERGSVLGGVWAAGYSNFSVQVQRELYEFPDWPLPDSGSDFTPGEMMRDNLEDYAKHFGIWPHIRFRATVEALRERTGGRPGWMIAYHESGASHHEEFDLVVICLGLYSHLPCMPRYPGQERFRGEILHISELATREMLKGKKVAVIGFGKGATDAALEAAAVASQTAIVFRNLHWPVPPKLLWVLPFKWAMLNRLTSTLIPLYYQPSGLELAVHTAGRPLVWLWWRFVELLLILQYGLWSRFGTRMSLVPSAPIEIDTFGESTMLPRPDFFPLLRKGVIKPHRSGINEFTSTGILLQNSEQIEADVIIFATGWKTEYGFLPETVRSRLQFENDGLYLYRQMLHPDVDHLAFIGYASTISSILTYNLQARWLAELITGNFGTPSRYEMLRDIESMKAWKRRWMPYSRARGARLLLHMQHYHDQLLRDLGVSPLRKQGIFAPFKEVFAPYQPGDYSTVVAGMESEHRLLP